MPLANERSYQQPVHIVLAVFGMASIELFVLIDRRGNATHPGRMQHFELSRDRQKACRYREKRHFQRHDPA